MKQLIIIGSALFLFGRFGLWTVFAAETVRNNNKYGIHLAVAQEEDIETAADLINGVNGSWGYLTVVIQENDRDVQKWQNVFDMLRKKSLIPIVRLATQPEGDYWRAPESQDAKEWVEFLNKLNWVVRDRYIILFNEPNHHSEWGGAVDSAAYRDVSLAFARALKKSDPDYVVMLAGFDASAPSAWPVHEDEEIFLRNIFTPDLVDEWNTLLGGWASHSYPNPGFAASVTATGRTSVRGYQWEQLLLARLGVRRLPVFITETGWDARVVGEQEAGRRMKEAYEKIWIPDPVIQAVTPFILNYPAEPFAGFSWLDSNREPHSIFNEIVDLDKVSGDPPILDRAALYGSLPYELVEGSIYRFPLKIRNIGQAIWKPTDEYAVRLEGVSSKYYYSSPIPDLSPPHDREVFVYAHTTDESIGEKTAELWLYRASERVMLLRKWAFIVVARPVFEFEVKVFPPFLIDGSNYEIQLYDDNEQLVFRRKDIAVAGGVGRIEGVSNVLFNHIYRVVLLRDTYLPRQGHLLMKSGVNRYVFPLTVPVDFNGDGTFNKNDIPAIFRVW